MDTTVIRKDPKMLPHLRRTWLAITLSLIGLSGLAAADVVTDWNEAALDAIRAEATSPLRASRALAILHAAIYDAVTALEGTHEPYFVTTSPPVGTSAEAAAAAAAHLVLDALFPTQQDAFDAQLADSLAAIPDGEAKDDGIGLGEFVAGEILAARSDDGADVVVEYTPGADPGDWQPTPPGFAPALLPQWPTLDPFAMTSGSQFRGDGPPALDSAEYATAFNEVKDLGRFDSATRTQDQTEIARFWSNGSGTATPPGHWNTIAQSIAAAQGNSVAENARLFALHNIAQADAAIVSWDNKYAFDHWRPVTAIPAADTDGNDATEADAEWLPLLNTPPFPEYTSGHSTFSGSASKVLELFYGNDDIAFSTSSDGLPGIVRNYTSFSQAADESGKSRIYGGIHWQYANEDGLSSGRALGAYVFNNYLAPIETGDGDGDHDDNVGPLAALCGALGFGNFAAMMLMLTGLRLLPRRRSA